MEGTRWLGRGFLVSTQLGRGKGSVGGHGWAGGWGTLCALLCAHSVASRILQATLPLTSGKRLQTHPPLLTRGEFQAATSAKEWRSLPPGLGVGDDRATGMGVPHLEEVEQEGPRLGRCGVYEVAAGSRQPRCALPAPFPVPDALLGPTSLPHPLPGPGPESGPWR